MADVATPAEEADELGSDRAAQVAAERHERIHGRSAEGQQFARKAEGPRPEDAHGEAAKGAADQGRNGIS